MDYKFVIDIARKNRKIFEKYLDNLSIEQLNTVPKGFRNSVIWNIVHTVVTQQILVYRLSNLSMNLPQEFIDRFKKGTKHEKDLDQYEIDYVKSVLFSTLDKTEEDYASGKFKTFTEYTVSTRTTLTNVDEALTFNNFHEGIHLGYILALVKSV